MSQKNHRTKNQAAFIFDRSEELGRLNGALRRDVTLVEFPVVIVGATQWLPFSRVGKSDEVLSETAYVVAKESELPVLRIETRTMNVSDYYAEVVDRDWAMIA